MEHPEIKLLDEAQTAAFLNAIRGESFERLFIVDLLTGLRQGELLGLRWKDVDFDAGTVIVAQQLSNSRKRAERISSAL
ncbi:MAG: tyrosine-type recombinase/integrase [Oscillospiraceae bacterium]